MPCRLQVVKEAAAAAAAAVFLLWQVSFGGLLLKVRGEQAQLSALEADMK